jgi:hypothetical protein
MTKKKVKPSCSVKPTSTSSRQHVHSASPSTRKRLESMATDRQGKDEVLEIGKEGSDTDSDTDPETSTINAELAIELNVCSQNSSGSDDDGACLFLCLDEAFPDALTVEDLDQQIELLHKSPSNNLTSTQCGIPGYSWHIKCVHMALQAKATADASFKFTWTKIKNKKEHELRDFLLESTSGKFIVIGTMNYRLVPNASKHGNWKHAVLIDSSTGMLHDPAGCTGLSRENMCIVPTHENLSKSDNWEGWLTSVQAVYRFNIETSPRKKSKSRVGLIPKKRARPDHHSSSSTVKTQIQTRQLRSTVSKTMTTGVTTSSFATRRSRRKFKHLKRQN